MKKTFRLNAGRGHVQRAVDEELQFHLDMRAERLIAGGMPAEAARAEALRQFGDLHGVREFCVTNDEELARTMHRASVIEELVQDLVYAARTMRRNLGFTAVVVLTLALGIGANTAIFTLIDALLLRTLPVHDANRLIAVGDPVRVNSLGFSTGVRTDMYTYRMYKELRTRDQVTEGLFASGRAGRLDIFTDGTSGQPGHARGRLVSGNYFSVLGIRPSLGRAFDGSEDLSVGASPVAVISDGYWDRRFKRDPGVVGRQIVVNNNKITIIGITPPGFQGEIVGQVVDLWLPVTMQDALHPNQRMLDDPTAYWLLLMGRRQAGLTFEQAQAGITASVRQLVLETMPATVRGTDDDVKKLVVEVSPGAKGFSRVRSTYELPLITLMIGVGLLLVIICANVANLLLARAVARGREMSVRVAIGAGRTRLMRQLLTESSALAVVSAGAGLAAAWWGSRALLVLAGSGTSLPLDVRLDLPVLGFTVLVSLAAIGLFGLVPAIRASRVDLANAMRVSTTSGAGNRARLGKLLIAAQVALSVVLLMGAALLVRSLRSVESADTGLDRDHLLIADVDARTRNYTDARLQQLALDLAARIARVPGVSHVSYSENGVFSGTESSFTLQIDGFVARTPSDTVASFDQVGPGYVRALGARLLAGREFTTADNESAPKVAIVNETMARFYWGSTSPIGKRMTIPNDPSPPVVVEVVGVIADVKDHVLDGKPVRRWYAPYAQHALEQPGALRFEIRTAGDPATAIAEVRKTILAQDASLPIDGLDPLSRLMRDSIAEQRLVARLATAFGVLALLLAAVGLYGVMSYAISRRTGEIGLRVALGAQQHDVIGMVLAESLRVVAAGVLVGLPLALLLTRSLRGQLHGVPSTDPVSISIALAVLGLTAIVAALLPAARAARVAPLVALRQE